MRPSSGTSGCCVCSGLRPGQHFFGSGMTGGAGSHPAEPLGLGQVAASKAEVGSEPQAWLWKSGNEWPTEAAYHRHRRAGVAWPSPQLSCGSLNLGLRSP